MLIISANYLFIPSFENIIIIYVCCAFVSVIKNYTMFRVQNVDRKYFLRPDFIKLVTQLRVEHWNNRAINQHLNYLFVGRESISVLVKPRFKYNLL